MNNYSKWKPEIDKSKEGMKIRQEKHSMRKVQLFCIPYAGGMADSFKELAELLVLPAECESAAETEILPVPLEYAGHGTRKTEPFYADFDDMTEDIARQIRERREPGCEFALLGYSMGSIAAYEILEKNLLGEDPCHIFVAAHEAPDVHWECKAYEQMKDEEFMERMISFGGFPNFEWKLLQNRFFRRLVFMPIREDYRLLSIYRMKRQIKLPAPATMIYSPQDIETEKIHSWDKFADGEMEYVELGRNHFFLKEHAQELAEILRKRV